MLTPEIASKEGKCEIANSGAEAYSSNASEKTSIVYNSQMNTRYTSQRML